MRHTPCCRHHLVGRLIRVLDAAQLLKPEADLRSGVHSTRMSPCPRLDRVDCLNFLRSTSIIHLWFDCSEVDTLRMMKRVDCLNFLRSTSVIHLIWLFLGVDTLRMMKRVDCMNFLRSTSIILLWLHDQFDCSLTEDVPRQTQHHDTPHY